MAPDMTAVLAWCSTRPKTGVSMVNAKEHPTVPPTLHGKIYAVSAAAWEKCA